MPEESLFDVRTCGEAIGPYVLRFLISSGVCLQNRT